MRLVFRILGADVFEISTDQDKDDEAPNQRGVSGSADICPVPKTFGFGAASPNDEPIEFE